MFSQKHVCPSAITYSTLFCVLLSLVDSIHGGSGHDGINLLDPHHQLFDQKNVDQLFAPSGAIRFPIDPVTEAWKEKVRSFIVGG